MDMQRQWWRTAIPPLTNVGLVELPTFTNALAGLANIESSAFTSKLAGLASLQSSAVTDALRGLANIESSTFTSKLAGLASSSNPPQLPMHLEELRVSILPHLSTNSESPICLRTI